MPTDRLSRLLSANADFAAGFDRGELKAPPREKLAVLTCMDCRIAVEELFGLEVGDVAVVRNAGAVVEALLARGGEDHPPRDRRPP